MSRESIVSLEHVSKSYRTPGGFVEALHEIDGELPVAAVSALVGVSGSGKSTLLRLIAGHDTPTAGRVTVRARHVAFVSQRAADNLFPQLTVAEHFSPTVPMDVLELLGVAHSVDRRASELSGGELARASIAVALGRGAELVVIDEPTAELDRATAAGVLDAIRAATATGSAFVVATHDPDVIEISDTVLDLTRRAPAPPAPHERRHASGEIALRADALAKSYGPVPALVDATLELHARELGVVIGRSGSGKSTLLMLLGGWLEPDHGSFAPHARAWNELAYVPQRFGLVPELTVDENIELPARFVNASETDLLARLDLEELRDRLPAEISIGQQQRVAVARALRLRPPVLLVDEPTSHQDAVHAELVWAALRDAAENGAACLVATHELDAQRRADVSWQIESGALA